MMMPLGRLSHDAGDEEHSRSQLLLLFLSSLLLLRRRGAKQQRLAKQLQPQIGGGDSLRFLCRSFTLVRARAASLVRGESIRSDPSSAARDASEPCRRWPPTESRENVARLELAADVQSAAAAPPVAEAAASPVAAAAAAAHLPSPLGEFPVSAEKTRAAERTAKNGTHSLSSLRRRRRRRR